MNIENTVRRLREHKGLSLQEMDDLAALIDRQRVALEAIERILRSHSTHNEWRAHTYAKSALAVNA